MEEDSGNLSPSSHRTSAGWASSSSSDQEEDDEDTDSCEGDDSSLCSASSLSDLDSLDSKSDLESLSSASSDCEDPPTDSQQQASNPTQQQSSLPNKVGSAEWYKQRLCDPLFAGSRISCLAFCYVLLTLKRAHRVRNSFFNQLLCLLSQKVFPEQHCAPPSWYLMRKIVG